MKRIVYKFGGTSLADAQCVRRALDLIEKEVKAGQQVLTVVSALGGITNELIKLCDEAARGEKQAYVIRYEALVLRHETLIAELEIREEKTAVLAAVREIFRELRDKLDGLYLLREITPGAKDLILSCGERLSAVIVAAAVRESMGYGLHCDTRELILTDSRFSAANVDFTESNAKIRARVKDKDPVWIFTGFIAANEKGETTTLGRSGSDYTASILGAALSADAIVIWTDVDGVMTANPRICPEAFTLSRICYEDAMELSHFGAKVIFPPTMIPAMRAGIPIHIRNSFKPGNSGTVIAASGVYNNYPATGIASIENIFLLRIQGSGMIGQRGILARLFECLARYDINIILITQASSEHSICIAIEAAKTNIALHALKENYQLEISAGLIDEILPERDATILAVVGEKMRHTPGIAAAIFGALGNKGINVKVISQGSSERNISIVIDRKDEKAAINALHDALFRRRKKQALYLIGTGNVGSAFIGLLKDIPLQGLANSRKMFIDTAGISGGEVLRLLEKRGQKSNMDDFIAAMAADPSLRKICVDCSASAEIASRYAEILRKGISLVTANKIANAADMEYYRSLKQACRESGAHYRYETTVGAALPVISTIRDLLESGDTIFRIEAMVSGTLSYLFNSLDGDRRFSEIIRKARDLGYTEPDPRLDLKGMDVLRKGLILAREIGYDCEAADIRPPQLIPENLEAIADIEAFLSSLEQEDNAWRQRVQECAKTGKKLRYILQIGDGKVRICIDAVDAAHPFYHVSGTDNIVVVYSRRYAENPLIIRGAGAGGELTASGVLADVRAVMRMA
ncbi:MAG: bifunctional aspartate kinase/homoserine dehydrogenase I [Candidatus Marinimicrobia bacterium]|nr:bifunctional aspartate kinase/homoserine dehydrogenase I [Candidatus Neomarinimicrobiota bacterium]